jgi:hypothetical protein
MNSVRINGLFRVETRAGGIPTKKHPRAAVWQIYLNLVTKGVLYILLQANKFPKEKLAHRRTIRTPIK